MSVIIRLQKLPWTANAIDIRRFFYGMSIPDGGVHIIGGELGDAFIAFSTDEDARKAMQLTGSRLNDAHVTLQLSSKNEMQTVIAAARGSIAPKVAESALPPASSYPLAEIPLDSHGHRDYRDGGPLAFGQSEHHGAASGQPADGRMQRPMDSQTMFGNSPRMQMIPDFLNPPPPPPFYRPDQERDMRGQPDRPDFGGRHAQPMQRDGQRFGEEMERRDVSRGGPDQFDRRHGGPPERPDFDRRHAEHGKEAFVPDTGSKQRHDVPNIGPGNKSGYGGGPRTMDRNFPGFQRDINYDRIDPNKPSVPAPNRRDSPHVGNEPGPGRDPGGFMKDTPRFPDGASVLDTDGRTQSRGPRPEQGGEFGRQIPMHDIAVPRFGRGEGMRHEDRSFDEHGREPAMAGSRLSANQSRMNVPPGPGGMEDEPVDGERGRHAPVINKDVGFPNGPGHIQGPPGANSAKRTGMEFDGMSREMPQQPGMPPREPMGFGRGRMVEPLGFVRGRPGDEMPKYKDGERNPFERDMHTARNGPGFDRDGPHKDGIPPGAGMGGRGPDFGRNVLPLSGEMIPGFPKGSPQAGRGMPPMNAEGQGVGRRGPVRDLGRPDMFQDTPMPDADVPGMGRGRPPQRDAGAPGFGRGGLLKEPEMPGGFNRGGMPREGEVSEFGRGGASRDADMPGFGRGDFGMWGPSEEAVQSKDGVPFDVERRGFRRGGPPIEMGRHGFGRAGPLMDMPGGPPRDVERPGFGRSGQPMDLDNRGKDVERPSMDRGHISAERQGFGRGGPRADVGGPGDSAPGFGRRRPRMDMGGPSGYVDGPGFQRMGEGGRPGDPDQTRMGAGRPPINMDRPGFGMGGPQQENDRHGFGQSRHDRENDGSLFNEGRGGPQDGAKPGRPESEQFGMHREEPCDRQRRIEPQFRRDEGQHRNEPMRLGPDHDSRLPRQNMRPPMKPGLLGDAPGDVNVNSHINPASSIPNLFDEPLIEGWHPGGHPDGHPGAADDRAKRRGSGRMERDYDRRDPPSSSHHDDELRRHDRKRYRGGGDADSCCVHVSGLPRIMNYRDIRRLFRGSDIPRDGLKVINDRRGQRVGECFIRFFAPNHAEASLRRDGSNVEGRTIRIRPCSEYDFDKAIDSYMPGSDDHGSRSSAKRPRSRSPTSRQHGDSDLPDTYLAVKNLPHKVTKADLRKFFGALRLVDDHVHIENHKETSTAYVQIASRRDYPAALDLHKQTLNSRAIDIFPISAREFQSQVALLKGIEAENVDDAAPKNEAKPDAKKNVTHAGNGIAHPPAEPLRKAPTPAKQPPAPMTRTTCVKMNGLPNAANGAMVKEFFAGLQLATRGINIIYNPDQTATGVAFVEFASAVDCEKALSKNRTSMGDSRNVSVEPINTNEMQMQMAIEKARIRVPLPVQEEKNLTPTPLASIPPPLAVPDQQRPAFGVLIRNTPFRITEVELHAFFQCCRPIPGSVKIHRAPNGKPTGDSMIAFHNPIDARRAVAELNGRFLMGRTLMLSL